MGEVDVTTLMMKSVQDSIDESVTKKAIQLALGQASEERVPHIGTFNVERVIRKTVSSCFHSCPHFTVDDKVMLCDHPYFSDKPAYSGAIISHSEDIQNGFPSRCPLFEENRN